MISLTTDQETKISMVVDNFVHRQYSTSHITVTGNTHRVVPVHFTDLDSDGSYNPSNHSIYIDSSKFNRVDRNNLEHLNSEVYHLNTILQHEYIHAIQATNSDIDLRTYSINDLSSYWLHPLEKEPLFNDIRRHLSFKINSLMTYQSFPINSMVEYYLENDTSIKDYTNSYWWGIIEKWLVPLQCVEFFRREVPTYWYELRHYLASYVEDCYV